MQAKSREFVVRPIYEALLKDEKSISAENGCRSFRTSRSADRMQARYDVIKSVSLVEAPMMKRSPLVPAPIQDRIFACQTEDDWDDEGATGITKEACTTALKFLEAVLTRNARIPMPRISSSVFGAVTFQWRNEDDHLIIRAFPNSELVSYHSEETGGLREIGKEARNEATQRVVNLFNSHVLQN